MKKAYEIFRDGDHAWWVIARDPERPGFVIDTNEYLVGDSQALLLADPGGAEVFPAVFSAIAEAADPAKVTTLFASHQDPDVISCLGLWLDFNPAIRCYVSRLWATFIPHFGGTDHQLAAIPDEGMPIPVGRQTLQAFPAHYLHSSGNFHLYDPKARLLFSGDVGAALLPADQDDLYVRNFDRHIAHARGFHQRWMGSKEAVLDWCERASALSLDLLCPQHGAIYQGADVERFIHWFAELPVGTGIRRRG
jgi:flavorubredoxin